MCASVRAPPVLVLVIITTLAVASASVVKRDAATAFRRQYGNFKENCFPLPSGGCRCNIVEGGVTSTKNFHRDKECRFSPEMQTIGWKMKVNDEIKERFGSFREGCFPRPSGGCTCNEKNAASDENVTRYYTDEQCKTKSKRSTGILPSQNVRDPVRERAQANYRAVVNELNEKFKGLKEGCFPRPKGCMCVIGKNPDGREITERRMKDRDCKCQPGERGPGCPAPGA